MSRTHGWSRPYEEVWSDEFWLHSLVKLGVAAITAEKWSPAFNNEIQPGRFTAGVRDIYSFVAQFLHETSMLKKMQEDLSYSSDRLMVVWPTRFPTRDIADRFAYKPQQLANYVYGSRMGNRPGTNDGWDFRGRGAGITGRTNYGWLGDKLEQDVLGLPSLLEQPHYALEAFFQWWEGHVPDAALSDQVKVRKVVNGGDIGLAHCKALFDACTRVLVA